MEIFDLDMDVFDMYLIGEMDYIYWDFSCTHIDKRLKVNRITLEYIKYMIFNEEPTYFRKSGKNRYVVYFKSPETKDYEEIKLIFDCVGYSIAVISVMPNNEIGTNKQQTRFYTNGMKNIKDLTAKAHAKRAKMY